MIIAKNKFIFLLFSPIVIGVGLIVLYFTLLIAAGSALVLGLFYGLYIAFNLERPKLAIDPTNK